MHRSINKRIALRVGAGVGAAGVFVLATAGSALADPFNDPSSLGKIQIQNAAGQQITTGNINTIGLATVIGTGPGQSATDVKATLYSYTPINGGDPTTWGGDKITASKSYNSVTMFPTSKPSPTDDFLADVICSFPAGGPSSSTADTPSGVYQLRLKSSGASADSKYYSSSITVAATGSCAAGTLAGTWTQNDAPAAGTPTGPVTAPASLPEAPYALLIPLVGVAVGGAAFATRRRSAKASA